MSDEEYDYCEYDYCDECRIYGDDYSFDEDGDMVCNCDHCLSNPDRWDEDGRLDDYTYDEE